MVFALWHRACHVNERLPMLKITLHDSAGEFRLKLEGRLSGPWVNELEQCWKTASSTTHDRKTVLDLGEVDFVDPAGESLLARASADDPHAEELLRQALPGTAGLITGMQAPIEI